MAGHICCLVQLVLVSANHSVHTLTRDIIVDKARKTSFVVYILDNSLCLDAEMFKILNGYTIRICPNICVTWIQLVVLKL